MEQIDPDIRAIQRQWRQDGRCLRCKARAGRAALCKACRTAWRYCPACERVYPISEASMSDASNGRATCYCRPCGYRIRCPHVKQNRATYLAQSRAPRHPRLTEIISGYRRGLSYDAIAAELGMSRFTLNNIIFSARKNGHWPKTLRRNRRQS